MNDQTNDRKIEHINIVDLDSNIDRRKYYFDEIQLTHRALPELDLQEIDPSVDFMGKHLSFPLLISSMTGGDHELLLKINRNLSLAAEKTGVAMAVGSQRVMFTNPTSNQSFNIRKYAPNALLFSNLGAVQLNYGFTVDHCQKALDEVQADALYFHLNPLQEAIQPEGDTNFFNLGEKIGHIIQQLNCPVVVKEVGSGITKEDVEILVKHGVKFIDVAGSGGTSWSRIEYHRQRTNKETLGVVFQDWGIPTPLALKMLNPFRDQITLVASGGIRNGIDMVKSLILGASLCGLASPFLKPAMENSGAVIEVIEKLKREFVTAMFLLGIKETQSLIGNSSLMISWPA